MENTENNPNGGSQSPSTGEMEQPAREIDVELIPNHPNLTEKQKKKVFVGGVAQNTTEADLKNYFARFGNIQECSLLMDTRTNRHRGFGFIIFDREEFAKIVIEIHYHMINRKQVECLKARPKDDRNTNRERQDPGLMMQAETCTWPPYPYPLDAAAQARSTAMAGYGQMWPVPPLPPSYGFPLYGIPTMAASARLPPPLILASYRQAPYRIPKMQSRVRAPPVPAVPQTERPPPYSGYRYPHQIPTMTSRIQLPYPPPVYSTYNDAPPLLLRYPHQIPTMVSSAQPPIPSPAPSASSTQAAPAPPLPQGPYPGGNNLGEQQNIEWPPFNQDTDWFDPYL
ncbi:RNA-binding protein Musashi homolog Rbp6-like [Harmonia axyridis]|uniref:RNA-binding protein Musashi homolog Rbp6-like n=1 Tax=Harmonia axyridis TaxID=115357 RepID=UPI001E2765B9|nr:RNA-binding protein Musashi homolog Rbp6-like [Harmonia axyridis]